MGPDVEIGWRLRRAAWGQGLATEAARPLIAHAFDRLKLARIIADIHPDNLGSRRVAEKLGLTPVAAVTKPGTAYLRYELTATTFNQR